MKKISGNIIIYIILLLILFTNVSYAEKQHEKTLIVILEDLDIGNINNFSTKDMGIGILNKGSKTYEELLLSLNSGRSISIKLKEDFNFLHKDENLILKDFHKTYLQILENNNNIKPVFLADQIKVGYIGQGDSVLLATNSKGVVSWSSLGSFNGEVDLIKIIDKGFSKTDVLVLDYSSSNSRDSIEILNKIIDQSFGNTFIIPKKVLNKNSYIGKNLLPIFYYKDSEPGVLTSKSTNRSGFVTIEDLSKEILYTNNIESKGIGHNIITEYSIKQIEDLKNIYDRNKIMFVLASFYHGLVYSLQVIASYVIYKGRKTKVLKRPYKFVTANFFISFIMASLGPTKHILIYLIFNGLLTYFLAEYILLEEKYIYKLGFLTYFMIIAIMFIDKNLIYNSYLGFNNLFYGARYYGFNNGIMAILLGSSLLTYYLLINNSMEFFKKCILSLIIFLLNIVLLSSQFGANTGGFISAVLLFLIMIYLIILDKNLNIRTLLILLFLGLLFFSINMYFDSKSTTQSHAIRFIERIKVNGFGEFFNMFFIKIKEFIKFTLMPPFSLALVSQIYIINKLYKQMAKSKKKEINLFIVLGLITFLINDTGVISLIYINVYIIAIMISSIQEKQCH